MLTRTATAPTRAITSMTVSAGLITINLSVFSSVESTSVIRKEFLDGNPDISVGRVPVRKDDGTIIDQSLVSRMAQADDGTWVVLTDEEITTCVGLAGGCNISTFVPIKDVGQYLVEGLYQVRPKVDKRAGATAAAEAAFSLLIAGMVARKVYALVQFSLRGAPRYALLTTEGDLLLIATADAIRESLPMPTAKHTKAAVDMVGSLIDAIGIDAPVIVDDVAPKVQAYVNDKAKAKGVTPTGSVPAPAPAITDIMAAMQATIDQAKKAKSTKSTKSTKAA